MENNRILRQLGREPRKLNEGEVKAEILVAFARYESEFVERRVVSRRGAIVCIGEIGDEKSYNRLFYVDGEMK